MILIFRALYSVYITNEILKTGGFFPKTDRNRLITVSTNNRCYITRFVDNSAEMTVEFMDFD